MSTERAYSGNVPCFGVRLRNGDTVELHADSCVVENGALVFNTIDPPHHPGDAVPGAARRLRPQFVVAAGLWDLAYEAVDANLCAGRQAGEPLWVTDWHRPKPKSVTRKRKAANGRSKAA